MIKYFFLLTWQKLRPLIIIYYLNIFKYLIIFIILSIFIRSIIGINYFSIKKIISFSSINQIRWLLISLKLINFIWKTYLIIYFFIIVLICYILKFLKLNYLNQIYYLNNFKNKFFIIIIFINFLSLRGIPPFLGFLPKLLILIKFNFNFILFIIILFSIFSIFYYIRIIFSLFLINSLKIKKLEIKKNNIIIYFSLISNLFLIFIIFIL